MRPGRLPRPAKTGHQLARSKFVRSPSVCSREPALSAPARPPPSP